MKMKKYKSNYMFTIMFQICNMFLITFPGVFLMWLILNPNEKVVNAILKRLEKTQKLNTLKPKMQ